MATTQNTVRVEKASEWAQSFGIATWTKFRRNSEPEQSIFLPLNVWGHSLRRPICGPIIESPQDYFLAIAWRSQEEWDKFQSSPEHQELMVRLTTENVQPDTKIMVFNSNIFTLGCTSNTEMFTVYWPASINLETQNTVYNIKQLVHTPASGIPNPRCYKRHPSFGWVDGLQDWNGEKVIATVWLHKWKNEELEQKFKQTEKRLVYGDSGSHRLLAVDAFRHDLQALGAVGWESIHVAFDSIRVVDEDATQYELRLHAEAAEAAEARSATRSMKELQISEPSSQ
ncbi:hypothetical protein FBEOM_13963 [Fusarium beomiforme]|uniref:Uncharacterized protein n=1 Tax=Fusarium beomiforme TaxID=44412 RepID=A0A9P5A606_9HYPO|nr:hypothetical protein FBEOM_13963 [Fusarium beomiforme]